MSRTKTAARRRRNRAKRRDRGGAAGRPKRTQRRFGGISAAAVGVIIAAIVGLPPVVDWVRRTIDPPPPVEIDIKVESVELTREREPLERYLRRIAQPLDGLSAVERREPGLEFDVDVRLTGVVGKPFPLLWTLIDADTGQPLADDLYRQEAVVFRPRVNKDARGWPIWVPIPSALAVTGWTSCSSTTSGSRSPRAARRASRSASSRRSDDGQPIAARTTSSSC